MDKNDPNYQQVEREARLRMLQEQVDTLQAVVAWLISRTPNDDGLMMLSPLIHDLKKSRENRTTVQFLSEIQEDAAFLRVPPDDEHK